MYIEQLKALQHPFVANLREVFQTTHKTCLIFDHIPFMVEEGSKAKKWEKKEIETCLMETIFGLLFLEQKNICISGSSMIKAGISADGHILLRFDHAQVEGDQSFNSI